MWKVLPDLHDYVVYAHRRFIAPKVRRLSTTLLPLRSYNGLEYGLDRKGNDRCSSAPLFTAAGHAQRAADYLHGLQPSIEETAS